MSLTPLGDIGIALKADVDDYSKAMASASDATGTLRGMVSGLASSVRNTGLAMTVASGIVGGAMVGMAMNAQQVSSAFREVDTISREVTDAQAEYGALVSDLNTQFGLQANRMEVIDGLYQSVSAGVTEGAEAQREFLETAAQLAVVGRVDLATTVDVLSTVMNTYGMNTEQAQDVSESLFQTVQFGKVRMEELAPVLGRVAALGSELDTQIDEIGASMAVLTRTGFDARVAATGLRNIFRAMMRPSETMQQMLREIALENDLFADSMEDSAGKVREIANEYQNATDALTKWENKQAEARATSEKSSLALQEARLKIEAIEEDRLDQLPDLTNAQVKEAESISELEGIIDDYQFKVNKARIEEENARQETEEWEGKLTDLRSEFKEDVDAAGDLEGSIGNLVLGNQDFIETLVDLRERANEQNVAFNELFPRTRALQGALALVGEDGQALTEVFEQMESGTLDAEEAWSNMDESARENFESFDAFKSSTEDVQQGDLQNWFQEATGEQTTMRNNIARLKEVIQDLGAVFSEDVTEALTNFADSVTKISTFAKGLSDSVRSNISQFAILATTLGLVLGPLLLIGGQFALIAQALGPALIPFLLTAGALFGILASAIKTAVSGGEGAGELFTTMRSSISGLIGFVRRLAGYFERSILPALINLGSVGFGIFSSIASNVLGLVDAVGPTVPLLQRLAWQTRDLINAFADFLEKNEDLIVNGITKLADILINRVIPDLVDFAAGVLQVIANINPAPFIAMAIGIGKIALVITDILGVVGRWMQRNDGLVAGIINVVTVVGLLLAGLGSLSPVFSAVGAVIAGVGAIIGATIVPGMSALGVTASILTGVLSTLTPVLSTIIPGFTLLSKVASLALTGIKLLAAGIGVLAGVLGLPVWATALLIAAFTALVASAWIAREQIIAAFKSLKDDFLEIIGILGDVIGGEISWKTAGNKIVETLVEGMVERISLVKDAAKTVANTVKDYLGFGSAPDALGEDYNPENYGENVSESFSEGMYNSEGEVEDATTEVVPDSEDLTVDMPKDGLIDKPNNYDPEKEMETPGADEHMITGPANPSTRRSGGTSGDITIEEKAIYFEEGAFQGVADDEIPEMVDEEVEQSLDDIVEDIRAKGGEPT